ncbi:putative ubiquitin activating enzyme [Trypanosoma grayi]|uniref:putative ubiquitin activating enzyme n=1 Tax=Trypanosoma grayi TaxID=71804 RepID=UPI0004F47438|nr:putative ubiquitin activating enzyme [Trypanosoma grayi]KEG11890.1 putative ubiquitin activating enzyme [Trypanosoma grayi]
MEGTRELELEVETTRRKLQELECRLDERRRAEAQRAANSNNDNNKNGASDRKNINGGATLTPAFVSAASSLTKDDVERFSRQMMVDGIGAAGMARIRQGRVLLVGAGGLGSTVALFLAAAGVGELRLVDFDTVEMSNLHRQVIHTTDRVGWRKVDSAAAACVAVDPHLNIRALPVQLDASNAEELMHDCDVVVDGTDNVAARYLINDAAMRLRKPVVSGSAMRWDGQLSVYGYGGSPCHRCLFPVPPPAEAVGSCNDTGVVGPVPGCIGCLQAMETLKILAAAGDVLAGRMLLFDGLRFRVRVVNLRQRKADCPACGDAVERDRTLQQIAEERPEYVMVPCASGPALSARLLPADARVSPRDFYAALQQVGDTAPKRIVVDVREKEQYDMAHLPVAVPLPLSRLHKWQRDGVLREEWGRFIKDYFTNGKGRLDVYVVCRRGIASTTAVEMLLPLQQPDECTGGERGGGGVGDNNGCNESDVSDDDCVAGRSASGAHFRFMNVEGGLNRFHYEADGNFPFY